MRWAGHVSRMPDHRAPKQLLYGELTRGKKAAHKPRLRFEDTLKTTLDKERFDTKTCKFLTSDMNKWRGLVADNRKKETGRRSKKNDIEKFFNVFHLSSL